MFITTKLSNTMYELVMEHDLRKEVNDLADDLVVILKTVGNKPVYVDFAQKHGIEGDGWSVYEMAQYVVLKEAGLI